jgi:nitroreductase
MSNSETITHNIRNRRTVKPKLLSDRPIDEAIIREMLENANWAPSHGMTEPWRFTVFTGDARAKLAALMTAAYQTVTPPEKFKPNKLESMATNPLRAPVLITIGLKRQEGGKISEVDEIQAVACAVQNMHLTATAHGLGAFWSSNAAVCSDQVREFVGLGENDRMLGLFYVGYPAGDWPTGERTPIDDKLQWRTE